MSVWFMLSLAPTLCTSQTATTPHCHVCLVLALMSCQRRSHWYKLLAIVTLCICNSAGSCHAESRACFELPPLKAVPSMTAITIALWQSQLEAVMAACTLHTIIPYKTRELETARLTDLLTSPDMLLQNV